MNISKYKCWSWEELLKMKITKTELAKRMGITCTYDVALPINWIKNFASNNPQLDYNQIIYSCFMVYEPGEYSGIVYSGLLECQQAINYHTNLFLIIDNLAEKYTTKISEELKIKCGFDISKAEPIFQQFIQKTLLTTIDHLDKEIKNENC